MKRISKIGAIVVTVAVTAGIGAAILGQTIFASSEVPAASDTVAVGAQPQAASATSTTPSRVPYLGVGIEASDGGIVVSAVIDGGPSSGKLQKGDVVLSVNGESVVRPAALTELISKTAVGETIVLGVKRGEETIRVQIAVGGREPNPPPLRPAQPVPPMAGLDQLMGQMKAMQGKGNPAVVNQLLKARLDG